MESVTSSPVSLTPGAVAEVRRLMAEPLFDKNQSLRLGVKGGGCSGMSYILPTDSDERFEIEGISCIMDKTHGIYLMGMVVDWQNGLNARGFSFINPNASKTCGCGSSFAV